MKVGCDRLVELVVREWDGQRRHGLRGVGNVRGGVWVVLKLEWQPLHPRTRTDNSCRGCSSSPPASSSISPPSWPSWQRGGFPFLFWPHPYLGLCGSSRAFYFSFSPITTFFSFLASVAASVLDPE